MSHTHQKNSNNLIFVVLPNGERQRVAKESLQTFGDFKRHIELLFGIPFELQRINITNEPQFIADWVPIEAIDEEPNTEVFVRTDQEWATFVSASLRSASTKVLDLLETTETKTLFDKRLYVALFIAVASRDIYLTRKLLNHRPYIDKRTASGRNILHIAVASGDIAVIQLILQEGGDGLIQAEDSREDTPLDLAAKTNQEEILQHLESHFLHDGNMNSKGSEALKFDSKRRISRTKVSKSLKLKLTPDLKDSDIAYHVSRSTPNSPNLARSKGDRLLDRQKSYNSLFKSSDNEFFFPNGPKTTTILPNIAQSFSNKKASLSPRSPSNSRPQSGKSDLSGRRLSSPVSPNMKSPNERRRHSAQPTQFPLKEVSLSKDFAENKQKETNTRQSEEELRGLQQVVFLPPWKRNGKFHAPREASGQNQEPDAENTNKGTEVSPQTPLKVTQTERSERRSHSVVSIPPEEIEKLQEQHRHKKPWNEWRRISMTTKNERADLLREIRSQDKEDQKISFERWLIEKEVMRDEFTEQMLEEERLKQIEKEKLEKERKLRSKTYDKWLAEKEVEKDEWKEEEKKREIEKKVLEDKIETRKVEAERKYEKWMREKYEEELRKEEQLARLLQDKWKVKQDSKFRRKSVATISTAKKQLTKTKSLPISDI